jgi:uncharacterized protein YqiB (DUF1249 family)
MEDNKYYEKSIEEIKDLIEANFKNMDRLFSRMQISNGLKSEHTMDPTANVLSLVATETKRSDDLRTAESRRVDEIMSIHAMYAEKLSVAEAKRIDAIRTVDVNAVSIASDRAAQQAVVLATQVTQSAETLRALVATTAGQVASNLSTMSEQLSNRISALEKSQYEKTGLGGVPSKILDRIDMLENTLSETKGRTGMSDKWQTAVGGIVGAVVTFVIIELMKGIP